MRAPLLDVCLQVGLSCEQRRSQSENHRGNERQNQREGKDWTSQMNRTDARQSGRQQGPQNPDSPKRKQHAGNSAEQAEQGAFCQQLTDDAAAARAERYPQINFYPASSSARKKQVGEVGAS